ncbi:MAG TPA: EamA family transporter [Acidimicrobiales bacterium]|nr:EamA family transporter [Acidimicrobiales bacterium]
MAAATKTRRVARRSPPAALLVAAGAVSVQFGAALATRLFARLGPAGAVTLRLVFAALALVVLNHSRLRHARRVTGRRQDLVVAVAFGLVLGAMNLSFYEALARIPLGVAVTVEFVGPLAVTIAGSRRWTDVVWAVLAGGGVFLLAGESLLGTGHHLDLVGIGLALVAGTCWAAYIVLNAQTGRRFAGTSGLAIAMVVGALAVAPFGVVQAGGNLLQPSALAIGLAVAVLSSVIPYSFELIALRRVTPRAFGILLSMEPGLAALAGFVALGQQLSGTEIVALLLVVAANVGSAWFDAREAVPQP